MDPNNGIEAIEKTVCIDQAKMVVWIRRLSRYQNTPVGQRKRQIWTDLEGLQKTISTYQSIDTCIRRKMCQLTEINHQEGKKVVETVKEFMHQVGFGALRLCAKESYEVLLNWLKINNSSKAKWILEKVRNQTKTTDDDTVRKIKEGKIKLHKVNLKEFVKIVVNETSKIIPAEKIPMLTDQKREFHKKTDHKTMKCKLPAEDRKQLMTTTGLGDRSPSADHDKDSCTFNKTCTDSQGDHNTVGYSEQESIVTKDRCVRPQQRIQCAFCMEEHITKQCPRSEQSREVLVRMAGRCTNCLSNHHTISQCRAAPVCMRCGENHSTIECRQQRLTTQTVEENEQLEEAIRKVYMPWTAIPCRYCNSDRHSAEGCGDAVLSKQLSITRKGLCNRCLSNIHKEEECRFNFTCKHCQGVHYFRHCEYAEAIPEQAETEKGKSIHKDTYSEAKVRLKIGNSERIKDQNNNQEGDTPRKDGPEQSSSNSMDRSSQGQDDSHIGISSKADTSPPAVSRQLFSEQLPQLSAPSREDPSSRSKTVFGKKSTKGTRQQEVCVSLQPTLLLSNRNIGSPAVASVANPISDSIMRPHTQRTTSPEEPRL